MASNGLTIDDLQIKITVNATSAAKSIDKLKKSIEELASVKTPNLDRVSQQIQGLQQTTSQTRDSIVSSMRVIAGSIRKVSRSVVDSSNQSTDALGRVGDEGWSLKDSLKSSFGYVTKAVDNLKASFGGLSGAIKRIAFYRLIRAAIKGVTQALREGVEMLIEWDRVYGNNTSLAAQTADTIAAKWREVKKTLGAAAMPIIQVFQPALMSLMQTVINVANTINQVFRAFQGFSTYIKATDKGFKSATASAKALKNVLFGFDELNVLPSDTGSGAAATIGAIDFEEVDIDSKLATVGAKVLGGVKKIFDDLKMTFDGVLDIIVGKFKVVLGLLSGDWQTVWEGLKQYIEGWGKTIAGIMQAILGVGRRLLEPVYLWVYDNVFKPIGEFFEGIPAFVADKVTTVKTFTIDTFNSIGNWFGNSFVPFLIGLPTLIWDALKAGAIAAILFLKDVWERLKNWTRTSVVEPISDHFTHLWENVKRGAASLWDDIKRIFSKVAEYFQEIFGKAWGHVKEIFSTGGKIFDGIKEGIVNAFTNIVNAIIRGINKVVAVPFNAINNVLQKIREISILGIEPFRNLIGWISVPQIPQLAGGGFIPNVGSLFIAGENGAELVTHAPNGTEVMNGNQVEQAMANANIEVINAIYAMANMVVGAVNNKNLDVYLDAQKVGKSVSQYQLNYARQYGG